LAGLGFQAGASVRGPDGQDHENRDLDLAAGTFIAVSIVSGMAFIIASAVH
jgi:hypothetical protein